MPMDWKGIAGEIARLVLMGGMGGRPTSAAGSIISGALKSAVASSVPGLSGKAANFIATSYPEEFSPRAWHYYDVVNIPGVANYNQHGKANESIIDAAGVMQELGEHNKAITQFLRPGMNPKEERIALQKGLEAEKNMPAFWNESKSRRPFSVSSSAVTGIRLTPDARIEVQWKSSPKWYTFKAYGDTRTASLAAQELLKADSIGRAVMPFQRNGKPINFKSPDVAWWNRKNYDGEYA